MADEESVTLWWFRGTTEDPELVEMDVSPEAAAALDRGDGFIGRWEQRRYKGDEARARLQDRLDELGNEA
jgi:hypothetical protein